MKTEMPNDLAIKRSVIADVSTRRAKNADCCSTHPHLGGSHVAPKRSSMYSITLLKIIQQAMECAYVNTTSKKGKRLAGPGSVTGHEGERLLLDDT